MSIINIFAPSWEIQDSYGRIACELAGGLANRGYLVNKFGDGAPDIPIHPALGGIFLGYPTQYDSYWYPLASFGHRIAITMFESTKLLDGWANALNKCSAVIVPAEFLNDIFRDNGIVSDIHAHPLGVSSEFLTHNMRRCNSGKPITFFAIVDRGVRKGGFKALEAFNRAFGEDMNYRLVLKSREEGALSGFNLLNENVEIIAADYSNEELADLYHRCDVMIFPTCGEGFGLPPREFAGTGGIALATAWGGTADNLREWGIPLPYSMETAWADKVWYGKQGDWASVDVDVLAKTLRLIANNIQIFAEDAVQSAKFVRETYQWSSFVDGVEQVWKQVSQPEVQYASISN